MKYDDDIVCIKLNYNTGLGTLNRLQAFIDMYKNSKYK